MTLDLKRLRNYCSGKYLHESLFYKVAVLGVRVAVWVELFSLHLKYGEKWRLIQLHGSNLTGCSSKSLKWLKLIGQVLMFVFKFFVCYYILLCTTGKKKEKEERLPLFMQREETWSKTVQCIVWNITGNKNISWTHVHQKINYFTIFEWK